MVYERNCGAIVMLSAISENGEVYRKGRGRMDKRGEEEGVQFSILSARG